MDGRHVVVCTICGKPRPPRLGVVEFHGVDANCVACAPIKEEDKDEQ